MRGGYIGGVVIPTPKPVTARRPVGTLRARLMGLVVGVVVMGWLVGGVATLHGARDAAARGRDARLVQMSHAVLAFARHELAESARDGQLDEADAKDRTHGLDLRYRYQVWRQGRLLVASADSPTDRALAHGAGAGFSESHDGARPQRVYAAPPDPAGLVVQVAEWLDEPGQAMPLPGMAVLVSMAASLLLAVALAGVLLVRVLRMLDAATDSLHRRSPQDAELLDPDTLPAELRPLVEALNQQWSLAAERLSHERGFTALAAHELRTPLAALRMQVQVALRAEEPAARNELLRRVLTSVDRCDHLIDQLLTLARVELGSQDGKASVDLGGAVPPRGRRPGRRPARPRLPHRAAVRTRERVGLGLRARGAGAQPAVERAGAFARRGRGEPEPGPRHRHVGARAGGGRRGAWHRTGAAGARVRPLRAAGCGTAARGRRPGLVDRARGGRCARRQRDPGRRAAGRPARQRALSSGPSR